MTRIDPHAHTLHSDGTDTPTELVRAAKDSGLSLVGITDHDTIAGWDEAADSASLVGVGLIRGVEVSAQWEGRPVHVLAMLPDPRNEALNELFEATRISRSTRLKRMTENLSVDYPLLKWDAVVARAAGAPLGRPHLADELTALGYFQDRSVAFEWALHPRGPYWEKQFSVAPEEAVRIIREAGGVPVFAHPRATKRGLPIPDDVIAEMVDAGLFGLERDHRDHSPEDRVEVERLARLFNLPMTGGSDYHGTGKPNRLGENLISPRILAQIEEQAVTEVIRP